MEIFGGYSGDDMDTSFDDVIGEKILKSMKKLKTDVKRAGLEIDGFKLNKVQADYILRASTIGKVTSTEKSHIHGDSSYCVPCTLHCG